MGKYIVYRLLYFIIVSKNMSLYCYILIKYTNIIYFSHIFPLSVHNTGLLIKFNINFASADFYIKQRPLGREFLFLSLARSVHCPARNAVP